ncbi:hypothetical protein MAR_014546 [Mya arenaria]|uniref:Uncharacterized protein n=1 Tax=Mya arenaria TaxID=6604 RepID=A0ABY7G699_MYAAR|nr:hypothetical protein MAR_014546 [Mya arenaria]
MGSKRYLVDVALVYFHDMLDVVSCEVRVSKHEKKHKKTTKMSPHGQTQRNNPRTKQQDNENVDNDAENRPPKKLKKAKGDKSKLKRPLITKAKQKLSHAERQEARRKNVLKIVKTTRGCYFIGVDGEGLKDLCCYCGEPGPDRDVDALQTHRVVLPICKPCKDFGRPIINRLPRKN